MIYYACLDGKVIDLFLKFRLATLIENADFQLV